MTAMTKTTATATATATEQRVRDPATCATLHELRMHHVSLALDVDMARRAIQGVATLSLTRVDPASRVTTLQLDVFHLAIHSVHVQLPPQASRTEPTTADADADAADTDTTADMGLHAVSWRVSPFTSFGEILSIELPDMCAGMQELTLVVQYAPDAESPAVCWLEKEQTAGGQHAFVYTQGQEVLNRSFFPCQDSPSVRITYDADMTVPADLVCVMSAGRCAVDSAMTPVVAHGRRRFRFEMKQSIPVYLVAMAVGDLVSVDVGPRSSVWTEPCMLDACRAEFTGILEKYLTIGEHLFGDYLWERYDLLVMPPSFPYGGMENPRLTFVSPCIIAGDRSLCSIIAHEISHSWFGNLVTNASWSDFFLNEGFTMYAERRISAEAHGRPLMCLSAKIGEALLREEIAGLGEDNALTRLRVPLETGIDPGDCYNQCAYEKGYAFVCYLRHLVGSDEVFDRFLRSYAQHFQFQSIDAEQVLAFFLASFPDLSDKGELKGDISFATWLHAPGFPQFTADLSDAHEMMESCETLVFHWRHASDVPVPANIAFLTAEAQRWPVFQRLYLLDCLLDVSLAHAEIVVALGDALALWESRNSEVRFRWSLLLIKHRVLARLDYVAEFLTMQGKQKFQLPIYRALVAAASGSDAMKQFAIDTYAATKPSLHVMVRDRIEPQLAAL